MTNDSITPVDYDTAMVHELISLVDVQNATITTLSKTVDRLCLQLDSNNHIMELCIRLLHLRTPSHFASEDLTDFAANVSEGGDTND